MDLTTLSHAADMPLLDTIDGAVCYELSVIICRRSGQSTIAGLARDWPVIQRSARIHELETLLAAEQQHASEAEAHVAELMARNEALTAQLAAAVPPAIAAAAVGVDAAKPANKHKKCPYCRLRPRATELQAHLDLEHPDLPAPAAPAPPIELPLADPPWRCAACGKDAFARSVADPARCISCVAHAAPTNGRVELAAA